MMKGRTSLVAAMIGLLPGLAVAQGQGPPEGLYISVGSTGIAGLPDDPGGTFNLTRATDFQKVDKSAISVMPSGCGGAPSGRHATYLEPGALGGWTAEVTPTRVVNDLVTFHLKWTRAAPANGLERVGGDYNVTLRAGQTMPLDILPALHDQGTCQGSGYWAIQLNVSVTRMPDDDREHRLMVTDLWLVDRLPDGTERSQPLTVRGLPFRPTSFFFDSVTDGGAILDFYGELVASPGSDAVAVKLTTRSRLVRSGQVDVTLKMGGNFYAGREVKTDLKLQNNAVAAIELPRLGENDSGAFANHAFSIRLRTRQVR
jgi:hypothetical protein